MLVEHLEKLRHFLRATSHQSISEAAQAMRMSQAGLSKSITSLEEALGAKLFIRGKSGLILTREGELTLTTARTIIAQATDCEAKIRAINTSQAPLSVRIGMYDSIAVYLFSDLSKYLSSVYPSVSLTLTIDTSERLFSKLSVGTLDIVVGVTYSSSNVPSENFFTLFDDWFSCYVAADIPDQLTPSLALIIHPLSDERLGLKAALKKLPQRSRIIHHVLNYETLKELTAQGIGIGVMPNLVARSLIKQKSLRLARLPQLPTAFGRHSIVLSYTPKFFRQNKDLIEDIRRLVGLWTQHN